VPLYPKQPVQPSAAHRTPLWRTRTVAAALLLSCGLAFAQHPGTPAVEPPRQTGGGGGGVGIGINIDLGSLFNAIKNATKKDEQTKPPVLQKKAVAVSSGNSGNYTVDWVVQYANNTSLPQTSVTVVDGPIATIIPGSVQPYPPVWVGATNANPPANNYAQWFGAVVPPHGLITASLVASSGMPTSPLAGSGDGYQPIPYTRTSPPAGRRFYFMAHHEDENATVFNCINADGTKCITSGTWPRKLPSGNGGSSGTVANNAEYVIDSGMMYYASQGSGGMGIGCFNLETEVECGFTKFANYGPLINGPWRVGNELYVAASDGALYCAKLTAGMASCLSSGYLIPATSIKIYSTSSSAYGTGYLAGKVIGSKLYITSKGDWSGNQKYTNCFDSTTKNACWNTAVPTRGTAPFVYQGEYHAGSNGNYNVSNFTYFDTAGVAIALCTMTSTPTAKQTCIDIATGSQKLGLPVVFPGLGMGAGLETNIGNKTYFVRSGYQPNAISAIDDAWCWNWTTQSGCTSPGGKIAIAPVITGSSTGTYGSNRDDQGCVWSYGHARILWGFNPANIDSQTGLAQPCESKLGGTSTSVFQPLQYCSGPKPFKWTGVEIKSATLANFDKMIVKVIDSSNNTVLLTKDLKTTNTLLSDITSIDTQTVSKPLKIEVEYTPKAGTSDKPYIEVRYSAPPPEFCFQSTHTCKQDKITNIVETPDPANPSKIISVKVDVNKPQVCPIIEPPPPVCGQVGQPPCPLCGTATTPACPACGQPGQPPCPACVLGTPGCNPPPPVCTPGTPNCPIVIIGGGCTPGTFNCPPRPPVVRDPLCLTADCTTDKPKQSVAEEYKEPKVSCVRKPKPVAEEPKKVAPKPRPKPAVVAAPVAVDPNAPPPPPKPKPKPRPKPVQAKPAAEDDCE
jgi:hypothetical protein